MPKNGLKTAGNNPAKRIYLTVAELGDYLRLSRHVIYAWIRKGVIPVPYYRLGCPGVESRHQPLRFLKSDVDAWMDTLKKIPAGLEYELAKNHAA